MSASVCLVCGEYDSVVYANATGCRECYSIEQGFIYIDDFKGHSGIVIDENGNIYLEGYELEGSIGCEWQF